MSFLIRERLIWFTEGRKVDKKEVLYWIMQVQYRTWSMRSQLFRSLLLWSVSWFMFDLFIQGNIKAAVHRDVSTTHLLFSYWSGSARWSSVTVLAAVFLQKVFSKGGIKNNLTDGSSGCLIISSTWSAFLWALFHLLTSSHPFLTNNTHSGFQGDARFNPQRYN